MSEILSVIWSTIRIIAMCSVFPVGLWMLGHSYEPYGKEKERMTMICFDRCAPMTAVPDMQRNICICSDETWRRP